MILYQQFNLTRCVSFSQNSALGKEPKKWDPLSNMQRQSVFAGGKKWRSAEALYHAFRFPDHPRVQEEIFIQRSPVLTKIVARRNWKKSRADWLQVREAVMELVLRLKLANQENWDECKTADKIPQLLRESAEKNLPIVEVGSDKYWGRFRSTGIRTSRKERITSGHSG
jgi:predicted NAD-dependent protein-ADP-ribosyltransferase YbiA (DUF1768 family)